MARHIIHPLSSQGSILTASDENDTTALILLDLSAAFDMVDKAILIDRLTVRFGLGGQALGWFRSFLSGRSSQVKLGNFLSTIRPITSRVHQGSSLSPTLSNCYLRPLVDLIVNSGLSGKLYEDDTQLLIRVGREQEGFPKLSSCLTLIDTWLSDNWLSLNSGKTELLWGGKQLCPSPFPAWPPSLGAPPSPKDRVRKLGVLRDKDLLFFPQIRALVREIPT